MRLYKAELFKLVSRKSFILGAVCTLCILVLFFWFVHVEDERTTVDGKVYTGYDAVRMNRKITEEFAGELTDEKAREIIGKYGFPQKVEEEYGGFRDANYLNDFVTNYLGDGYMSGWDDYKVSTKLYPVSQTELGEAEKASGKKIMLEYTDGWAVFLDVLQMGMMIGSILILSGISVVFADEGQVGMLPLLFTAEEGKGKDVIAKIAACFTSAAGIFAVIALISFLMCGAVYGYDGAESMVGMVSAILNAYMPATMLTVKTFVCIVLILNCLGILSLCAVTLCVSAYFKSTFHAVVVSAILWGAPLLIRIVFGGLGYLLMSGTPIFLVMTNAFFDISSIWMLPVTVAFALLVLCTLDGYRRYRKLQVEA